MNISIQYNVISWIWSNTNLSEFIRLSEGYLKKTMMFDHFKLQSATSMKLFDTMMQVLLLKNVVLLFANLYQNAKIILTDLIDVIFRCQAGNWCLVLCDAVFQNKSKFICFLSIHVMCYLRV